MYFETAPKTKKADMYNFDYEFNQLTNFVKAKTSGLAVVYGLRRTGKTSLIHVTINENRIPHIWLDGRNIESRIEFFTQLKEELISKKMVRIETVDIKGIKLSTEQTLKKLLEKNKSLTIIVDEAQYLAPFGLDKFFAYLYDNFDIKIIFSGSEVGVLNKFIGQENPQAPFFGRAITEIKTRRLNKNEGIKFLIEGGKQMEIIINEKEAEIAVNHLDGIIGWLTLYGWYRKTHTPTTVIKKVIETGKTMAQEEFDNFISTRKAKKKYVSIMKILGAQTLSWSEIKSLLSKKLTYEISDTQISLYLKHLEDYSFIEKVNEKYKIADPLLEATFY